MIFYLTYSDPPSGIYSSQVIDVVKFIRLNFKKQIRLISFVSIRNYKSDKAKIKTELPDAIVLPMFPKVSNWKFNKYLLMIYCIVYKPQTIIGRSVIATELALIMRKNKFTNKVIYDGRGAIAAEWSEYNVVNDENLVLHMKTWEKEVVLNSDYRIAVSNNLVSYWKERYQYNKMDQVIIPCTINHVFEKLELSIGEIERRRAKLNFTPQDIVFVYSGSLAGWQSFDQLNLFLKKILSDSLQHKMLFLSDKDNHIANLQTLFPNQVYNLKVAVADVPGYLLAGDYGILLREQSVTNQVASPVKFAEYVACGLKVIISDNLGDYSELIEKNSSLGFIFNNQNAQYISVQMEEKLASRKFAMEHFTKNNFVKEYGYLVKE